MKESSPFRWLVRWQLRLGTALVFLVGGGLAARAVMTNFGLLGTLHSGQIEHADQQELLALVEDNQTEQAFADAFEHGDKLFETSFNVLDGAGANVGQGQRFTRVPRADLTAPGQWANHTPARVTGPNAQSCNGCHNQPADDGAGGVAGNALRDPEHSGVLAHFIQRNTPHLFGAGAVQRLAEEMTADLQVIRARVAATACAGAVGNVQSARLNTKGINFGTISARRVDRATDDRRARRSRLRRRAFDARPPRTSPREIEGCAEFPDRHVELNTAAVSGVDDDLVIKPFQWKGSVAFVRDFNRSAAHNEIGMQAVELAGDGIDGDFDGVADEMTVGDQTALAVYIAAQPRPVTTTELASLGLMPPLSSAEQRAITDGESRFHDVGCDACHKPTLVIDDALFSEPSQRPEFRDDMFPGGQDPVERGVDPAFPITFDLTTDLPDNRLQTSRGIVALGNHVSNGSGGAIVHPFGDLKRHDLGAALAEGIDEVGTGASTFLTENLWGLASTAPYLHDGRATTLTEAIIAHGGEAAASRDAFEALAADAQRNVIAFLNSLVLFKMAEE